MKGEPGRTREESQRDPGRARAVEKGDRLTLNNLGGNESFLPQECKEAAWVYIGAAWGSVAPGKAAVTGDRLTLNNLMVLKTSTTQKRNKAVWVYIGVAWGGMASRGEKT